MMKECKRCKGYLLIRKSGEVICLNANCDFPKLTRLQAFTESLKYIWAATLESADEATIDALDPEVRMEAVELLTAALTMKQALEEKDKAFMKMIGPYL